MMSDPKRRSPLSAGSGYSGAAFGDGLQRNHTPGGPLALLLSRLDRVRKAGKGHSARCPAHPDKTASLSLCEGSDGRVLLHCFAGCDAASVVQAVGLTLADLYPERLGPLTPERKQELRQYAREANWRAAVAVLGMEAAIVEVAATQLIQDRALDLADWHRLSVACERIASARAVLQ